MTQEALKLALEALEVSTDWDVNATGKQLKSMQAITALRKALAQPEQLHASEDVSIGVDVTEDGAHVTALRSYRNGAKVVFYSQFHSAPQRTWVDLTRTQMQDVYFKVLKEHRGGHQMQGQLAFGEALQAKLKEKNT